MLRKRLVSLILVFACICSFGGYVFACDPSYQGTTVNKYDYGSWLPWDDAQAYTSVCVANQHEGSLLNSISCRTTVYYKNGGTVYNVTYANPVTNYFSTDTGWVTATGYDYAVMVEHRIWDRCDRCNIQDGPNTYTSGNGIDNMTSTYNWGPMSW